MNLIDNLSDSPAQQSTLLLPDGTSAILTLNYRPTCERWAYGIAWGAAPGFVLDVNGGNLCMSPNILRQWKNLIPFGLACMSTDNLDPLFIDDFTSGRISLYILSADEVAALEASVFGPATVPAS